MILASVLFRFKSSLAILTVIPKSQLLIISHQMCSYIFFVVLLVFLLLHHPVGQELLAFPVVVVIQKLTVIINVNFFLMFEAKKHLYHKILSSNGAHLNPASKKAAHLQAFETPHFYLKNCREKSKKCLVRTSVWEDSLHSC